MDRKKSNNRSCAICGSYKFSPTHSVCKLCDNVYASVAAKTWGGDRKGFISRNEWLTNVLQDSKKRLEIVNGHLEQIEESHNEVIQESLAEAEKQLLKECNVETRKEAELITGKTLFEQALKFRQSDIYVELGGKPLFARLKALQNTKDSIIIKS